MKPNTDMHQTNQKNKRNRRNGGFTLVELIVVIVIMGILTAAILPTVTGYVASAQKQVKESNQHMVEQAAYLYMTNWEMDNSSSDGTTITAADLVAQGYLSALPDGENYTVTITKGTGGRYTVEVEANTDTNGENSQQS